MSLEPDTALRRVALEIEAHVGSGGWDQAPRLFALVPTAELIQREPGLAGTLSGAADGLTPVEQDGLPADRSLEDALTQIAWPDTVLGCAAVLERIMLPPEAEDSLPDDPEALLAAVAAHPERRDVRLVAAVIRAGESHSAVRARTPADAELLEGPELVPGLVEQLRRTLT